MIAALSTLLLLPEALTASGAEMIALLSLIALVLVLALHAANVLRQLQPAPRSEVRPVAQPAAPAPTAAKPAPAAPQPIAPTGTTLVPLDSLMMRVGRELRAHLTTIMGNADLVLDGSLSGPQRADKAVAVLAHCRRLATLVSAIEDLGGLTQGNAERDEDTFSIDRLCHDVVASVQDAARNKDIEVRLEPIENKPLWINSDPAALRRILTTVLQHAIDRTPAGTVRLAVHAEGRHIGLCITDDGPEVPADVLDLAFAAFWSLQPMPQADQAGFGIAMALAKRMALSMGGDLQARPASTQGIEFELTLPMVTAEPWQIDLEESDSFHRSLQEPTRGRPSVTGHVLLVEDARDQQLVVGRMLERAGAEVTIASSGDMALQLLEQQAFDLVLMDLQMPGTNGLQATQKLRARHDQTPIVALTADSLAGDVEQCIAAGCNSHLAKPVEAKTLERTLAMYLQPATKTTVS